MARGRVGRLLAIVWAVVSGLVAAAVAVRWCGSSSAVGPGEAVVWVVVGVAVGLMALAWGLHRRAARRARYPQTLVYDVETGAWVAVCPLRPLRWRCGTLRRTVQRSGSRFARLRCGTIPAAEIVRRTVRRSGTSFGRKRAPRMKV
jgi:hypothetical protein